MDNRLGGVYDMKEMFEESGGVMIAVILMAVILSMTHFLCSAYEGIAGWFAQSLGSGV